MADPRNNEIRIDLDASRAKRGARELREEIGKTDKAVTKTGESARKSSRGIDAMNKSLSNTSKIARMNQQLTGGRAARAQGVAGITPQAIANADKMNDKIKQINRSAYRMAEAFSRVDKSIGHTFVRGGKPVTDLMFPDATRTQKALNQLREYRRIMQGIRQGTTTFGVGAGGQASVAVGGQDVRQFGSTSQAQAFHDRAARRRAGMAFVDRQGVHVSERIDKQPIFGGHQAVYGKRRTPFGEVFGTRGEVNEFLRQGRAESNFYRAFREDRVSKDPDRAVTQGKGVGVGGYGIRDKEGNLLRTFSGAGAKMRARGVLAETFGEVADYRRINNMPAAQRTFAESQLRDKFRRMSTFQKGAKLSVSDIVTGNKDISSGMYGVRDAKGNWLNNKFFSNPDKARAYRTGYQRMGSLLSGATLGKGVTAGEMFDTSYQRTGYNALNPAGNVMHTAKSQKAVSNWIKAQENQTKAMKESTKANRRQGIGFMELTSLMVKFGIAMAIIQLPFQLAGMVGGVIGGGADREQQLAHVRALTYISKPGITHLGLEAYKTMQDYPVQGDYFVASEEIASSLATLAPSIAGMGMDVEAKTIYDFLRLSAQYAQAVNVNVETAVKSMTSLGSATKQNVEFLEGYGDIMATTIDVGRISASTVSTIAGEQIGYITSIWGGQPERQRDEFQNIMEVTAAASQTLPEGFLRASITNWIKAIRSPDTGAVEYMQLMRENTGVDITFAELHKIGFRKWIQKYSAQIGPYGTLVDKWITTPQGQQAIQTEGTEEIARQVGANEVFRILFPNIRGERFQIATLADLGRVLGDVVKGFETTKGAMTRQAAIRGDTFATQTQKAGFTWNMMQDSLFQSRDGGGGLRSLVEQFNDEFNQMMNSTVYRDATIEDKLVMLFDRGFDMLDRYMKTGGFDKIMGIMGQITAGAAQFITMLATDPLVMRAITTFGGEVMAGIARGMISGIPGGLMNLFEMIIDPANMFDSNMRAVKGSKLYETESARIRKAHDLRVSAGRQDITSWIDQGLVSEANRNLLENQLMAHEEQVMQQDMKDMENKLLPMRLRGELDITPINDFYNIRGTIDEQKQMAKEKERISHAQHAAAYNYATPGVNIATRWDTGQDMASAWVPPYVTGYDDVGRTRMMIEAQKAANQVIPVDRGGFDNWIMKLLGFGSSEEMQKEQALVDELEKRLPPVVDENGEPITSSLRIDMHNSFTFQGDVAEGEADEIADKIGVSIAAIFEDEEIDPSNMSTAHLNVRVTT